jgi:antitoxin component HigA of HigAB toxin-antitoxin module
VLVTLVELYEAKRWPVETESFDPIDVLRYSIEEFGHTQASSANFWARGPEHRKFSPAGGRSQSK